MKNAEIVGDYAREKEGQLAAKKAELVSGVIADRYAPAFDFVFESYCWHVSAK